MTIIGPTSTERVIPLGEQLKHELMGGHAKGEQHGVVPVIGVQIILGLQLAASCNLDRFMSMGAGVDILGREFGVGFIEIRHGSSSAHQA